jgi:hypothetical protein
MTPRTKAVATGALALACALLPGASPLTGPAAEADFVPAPELKTDPAGPPLLRDETWSDETPEYTIRLQRIDDGRRLAYLTHVTGLQTDPFMDPPGQVKRFENFVIQIENRGKLGISFNPLSAWLVSEREQDLRTPYGMEELRFAYSSAGLDMPPAYMHAQGALLDRPIIIEPGASASGLLLYRAPAPKSRKMQVELSLTLPSGDIVRFVAPYRRLTKKELAEP